MATFATFFLGKAQKFEVSTKTDDEHDEIKIEIKTVFDKITLGLNKDQAGQLSRALKKEMAHDAPDDEAPPF